MNKISKIGLTCGLILSMLIGISMIVYAENTSWEWRGHTMNSHGRIRFFSSDKVLSDPNIVIDAVDISTIASEVDLLENIYKTGIASSINQLDKNDMVTDVSAQNDDGSYKTFGTLQDAILNSQSIPNEGREMYVLPNGSLASSNTEEGATAVQIHGATAENLSVGSAAWVDGELIVGNGTDNNSYYAQGYIDGVANAASNITYIYHNHTAACYEEQTLNCSVSYIANDISLQHCAGCQKDHPDAITTFRNYIFRHNNCGASDSSGSWCTNHSTAPSSYIHNYTATVCICGKTENTIESAIVTFR